MKIRDWLEIGGNGAMYGLTALQPEKILAIVNLSLSILISILIIISKVIDWYKKAKEDGKITPDEIKEGVDIIVDGAKDLQDKTKKGE